MQREVKFYDPHPGFGGAIVPLPKPMYRAACELDGQTATVEKTLEKLRPLAERLNGSVEDSRGFILFEYRAGGLTHGFRLIRYRKVGEKSGEPVQLRLSFE